MRGTPKKAARRITASVVAATAVAGVGAAASPAEAAVFKQTGSVTVTVPESSGGVPVYLDFKSGDEARITCSGKVWGGVWFTGDNGPDGWADKAPDSFPMPGWQGGRSFAAIARFKGTYTSSWSHAGTSSYRKAPWYNARMELRVNDNAPGNGSGAFTCEVARWSWV